jgi:hypothetical protein
MAETLWATPEDVEGITRKQVTEDNIAVAQEIVALEAGIDPEFDLGPDTTAASSANRSKLVRAVAWQAVWVQSHPDVLETMDVTGVSQDGVSATYASEAAHFLAPLAARCIRRLSWKLAPLRAHLGRRGTLLDKGNRDNAERDDQYDWDPMGRGGQLGGRVRAGQVWR